MWSFQAEQMLNQRTFSPIFLGGSIGSHLPGSVSRAGVICWTLRWCCMAGFAADIFRAVEVHPCGPWHPLSNIQFMKCSASSHSSSQEFGSDFWRVAGPWLVGAKTSWPFFRRFQTIFPWTGNMQKICVHLFFLVDQWLLFSSVDQWLPSFWPRSRETPHCNDNESYAGGWLQQVWKC